MEILDKTRMRHSTCASAGDKLIAHITNDTEGPYSVIKEFTNSVVYDTAMVLKFTPEEVESLGLKSAVVVVSLRGGDDE